MPQDRSPVGLPETPALIVQIADRTMSALLILIPDRRRCFRHLLIALVSALVSLIFISDSQLRVATGPDLQCNSLTASC